MTKLRAEIATSSRLFCEIILVSPAIGHSVNEGNLPRIWVSGINWAPHLSRALPPRLPHLRISSSHEHRVSPLASVRPVPRHRSVHDCACPSTKRSGDDMLAVTRYASVRVWSFSDGTASCS